MNRPVPSPTRAFGNSRWRQVLRAQQRYSAAHGDIYAAGISYFTLFAMFPLLMLGFSAAGFVLASRPQVLAGIDKQVKASVPGDIGDQVIALMDSAIDSRTTVGVVGLATALYVGLLWVQRLRTALGEMWQTPCAQTGFLGTKLSDLRALAGVFAAGVLTIALTALANPVSIPVSILLSWGLFTLIIARLPRRPVALRRCWRAGLLAAVGFELLKQAVAIYLRIVLHGPAGIVFGPVLAVLVFAYLTARLVLFATAWAATADPASAPAPVDSASGQP